MVGRSESLAPARRGDVSRTADRLPDDYDVPAFNAMASENPAMRWDFFVRHYGSDARQRQDPKYVDLANGRRVDGILYPRAGTLGGCTAHNAMIVRRIQEGGEFWVAHARIDERIYIRPCIVNYRTSDDDVLAFVEQVERVGRELLS